MAWRHRLIDVRPLRTSRPFRDLWIGMSLGVLGHQIAKVAVLLQVWDLTRSPLWTGVIGLATAIPILVLAPVGGWLADTIDRRTLVRATTTGQVLSAVALAGQAVAGNESVAFLLALVALLSACGAMGSAARGTFPVRLLPAGQVAAGLALQNVAFQASMLVGPALAGVVLARWGYAPAYALQAVASGASLLAVIRLPSMPPLNDGSPAEKPRRRRAARGGWRIILHRKTLWGSFATDLAATVLAMPIALFPLVNDVRFGGDPRTLGLFLSAVAVGGIGAGLLSGTVTRLRRSGLVQLTAATVWGVGIAVFGLVGPLWLALASLAVAGAADTVSVVTRGALVQLETPDRFRGRVTSVEHVIGVAGPEVGNFRGGLVASLTSAPVALMTGGLAAVLAVVVVGLSNRPLREYRVPAGDSADGVTTGAPAD